MEILDLLDSVENADMKIVLTLNDEEVYVVDRKNPWFDELFAYLENIIVNEELSK